MPLTATGVRAVVTVIAAMEVVVGGYILGATIVDYVDNKLEVKDAVTKMAR